ncbi:DUF2860 family protein [Ferrimonas lipolytica]|uniref:DUF2860 family protein n=1 Tax=Ferrimonas lipolytica TaxID=2724191 RepID=A0A6H1UAQ7_9GAMM|nr:DUF2860 family protein [Ferrimonas lipolytica]QIZ75918.1 DUF2860 family protein [Ferrimonas lipolytica]
MIRTALAVVILAAPTAWAADPFTIPQQQGWSGFVGGGVGYYSLESNFVAGTRTLELGDENIDSLNSSADRNDEVVPELAADLRYTFSNLKTQAYFGNLVQDQVRLDWTQRLGVRHQTDNLGMIGASVLFSMVPTEVWEDPYQLKDRDRTDRSSSGIRLSWDAIAQSPFGMDVSYREIEIDTERSGRSLPLSSAEVDSLDREGNSRRVQVYGRWIVDGQHIFIPAVSHTDRDLDGSAEKGSSSGVQMSYAYIQPKFTQTFSGYFGKRDYDNQNPIYGKKADADEFGLTSITFVKDIFGWQKYDLRVTASYVESDSDLNFFDSKMFGLSFDVLYQI